MVIGALAILILIWGTTWAAIRIGLEGIPPFTGIAIRFAIASVVLIAIGLLAGLPLGSSRRERLLWLVNALLTFSVSYGVVYWAEQWVPSGLAAILFSTFPLFVAGLAHFWLPGERLKPLAMTGIAVGFLGIATIFSGDFEGLSGRQVQLAALVFLVSPFVSALANVTIKRWGQGVHPMALTAIPMGMTAGIMAVLAGATERNRSLSFDQVSLGALLYLAIPGTAVTFLLYFWLLDRLPATRLSLITYGVPIVAVIVGSLFLGEPFTVRMFLGGVLVLVGVGLALQPAHSDPTGSH